MLTLAEVGLAGRPVVHLQIDVRVIIYTPRSVHVVVPHALQVGWHVAGARRGDEKVTAKLIVELLQIEVSLALPIVSQPLCYRQVFRAF